MNNPNPNCLMMATKRETQAYSEEMQIILLNLSHQLETQPVDHLYRTVGEELISRGGFKRSIMTNKIMRRAHAVLFIIFLITAISELLR